MFGQNKSDEYIKKKLIIFIKDKFILRDDTKIPGDDDSFLEKGIIDSTGVLELVSFLEETFNIKIEDEELVPDNLDSINKITTFIQKKV